MKGTDANVRNMAQKFESVGHKILWTILSLPKILMTEETGKISESMTVEPKQKDTLSRKPGWTGKFLIFFSGLLVLEQRAKKCIELRGERVE